MTVRLHWLAAACVLTLGAGCKKKREHADPPNLLDTGWFDTATLPDPDACTDVLVATVPETGATGWYWRDRPQFLVSAAEPTAYVAWLEKGTGERLITTVAWDDTGLVGTLTWDGFLEANTDYVLGVEDCAGEHTSTFRTSEFGRPLDGGPATVEDRTYLLDLVSAEWTEPAILSSLIQTYFNTPILLGVRYVDDERIDILGAPGVTDTFGNVSQDVLSPTWDFPLTDFTTAPYLETNVDAITLQYRNGSTLIDIPVSDFELQLSFSADGTRTGGGIVRGLADSRNLGLLLDDDSPDAICLLAEPIGVPCLPCPDGQEYCLQLVGEQIEGDLVTGLTLVEIGG